MNYIKNKNMKNWILAVFTALGAYGGFPDAPQWWKKLAKFQIFQYFVLWVLVYQGGGQEELIWTTVISLVVYILMNTDKIIAFVKDFLTKRSMERILDQTEPGKRHNQ